MEVEQQVITPAVAPQEEKPTEEEQKDAEDEEQEEPLEKEDIESEIEIMNIRNKPILPKLTLTAQQTCFDFLKKADINRAFELLDQQGSGLIDTDNFKIAIKAMGYEVTSEELKSMIESVGETSTGKLSVDDFTTLIIRKIAEKDTDFDIVKSFLLFDVENNDFLTFENMKTVAEMLEEDLNDEEILEMFDAADEDGDGIVTKEEFLKMIKSCVTLVTP